VSAALAAGLLAGYGIAMPVGAVGAYLVALTARTSLRTGVFAALGVASAPRPAGSWSSRRAGHFSAAC
jgi:threonine/homoserine/homoserine lactone efflux protein